MKMFRRTCGHIVEEGGGGGRGVESKSSGISGRHRTLSTALLVFSVRTLNSMEVSLNSDFEVRTTDVVDASSSRSQRRRLLYIMYHHTHIS